MFHHVIFRSLKLVAAGSDDGRVLICNLKSKEVVGSFQCKVHHAKFHLKSNAQSPIDQCSQNSVSIIGCDNMWPLLAAGDDAGRLYFFRFSESTDMHMLISTEAEKH